MTKFSYGKIGKSGALAELPCESYIIILKTQQ
jgi:hypothetical protein